MRATKVNSKNVHQSLFHNRINIEAQKERQSFNKRPQLNVISMHRHNNFHHASNVREMTAGMFEGRGKQDGNKEEIKLIYFKLLRPP
jgi:hypothetical protein